MNRKMFIPITLLTIALMAALAGAACGDADTPTPVPPTPTPTVASASTVVVSVKKIGGLQAAPFYVALEAGYFEDEGLELELRPLGGRGTLQGMGEGEIQVAVMTSRRIARAFAEGETTELIAFALLLKRPHHDIIIKEDVAAALGITADSPLEDKIAALKGLTIILPNRAAPFLEDILGRGGVRPDEVSTLHLDQSDQAEAFVNGDGEVCFCHTPALEDALFDGNGMLLVSLSEGEIEDYSDLNWVLMVSTAEIAEENPELLVSVARAIARAQQLILDETPEDRAAGRSLRKSFVDVSPEKYRFIRDLMFAASAENPLLDANKMATGATFYGVPMTLELAQSVINNEFAEEALSSLE